MIAALLSLLALPQSIEASPSLAEEGATVEVRVVDAERRPMPGVEVVVGRDGAVPIARGQTDAQGEFRFEAREPGDHGVRADVAGPLGEGRVRLIAPLHVAARPARAAWRLAGGIVAAAFALAAWKLRASRSAS
jgi:protocatechuate 3,4-dioxygenase beta subunit